MAEGGVQPFIAQGLNCAGHIATLASHAVMKNLVVPHGVAFAPISPDIDLAVEVAATRQRSRNTGVGLVHHGGFGTSSAGLRAGIPALVIPHMTDQIYWAQRVYELGAGPQPIRRTNLEPVGLASALQQLAQDENLRTAASALGEQIRAEKGAENAVRLIEETFLED